MCNYMKKKLHHEKNKYYKYKYIIICYNNKVYKRTQKGVHITKY